MPLITKFKSGYLLEVISSENDADNYATNYLDGLTYSDVIFYLDLCERFKFFRLDSEQRKHYRRNKEVCINNKPYSLGNCSPDLELLETLLMLLIEDHPTITIDLRNRIIDVIDQSIEVDDDYLSNVIVFLYEFLGYPVDHYYAEEYPFYCRYVDAVKVFNIPHEIKFDDITKDFDQYLKL